MSVFIAQVFGIAAITGILAYLSRNEKDQFLSLIFTFTTIIGMIGIAALLNNLAVSESMAADVQDLTQNMGGALNIILLFYFFYSVVFRAYIEGLFKIVAKTINRVMTGG